MATDDTAAAPAVQAPEPSKPAHAIEDGGAALATNPVAAEAPVGSHGVGLDEFKNGRSRPAEPNSIALIQDVELRVKIELGRTRMYVEDVLRLGEGSVVELDKLAGDPVDVFVNDRLVARGEVLVLNDNFCVRVSEIISEPELKQAG